MIAFIQWTTPMMLAGMSLLSLPLIAHFMYRRSRRRIVVPTLRFFQQSVSQHNHLLKLKRWLLLLLRCLAVALIVFVFTRPVWQSNDAMVTDDAVAMAIVIDASLSTSQRQGNSTSFQNFIAAAERSLNQLESGRDVATVIIAAQNPRPIISKLSKNLNLLKTQLASLEYVYERADIEGALAEASRQLSNHPGRKVLTIISDMQVSNWLELLANRSSSIDLPSGVEVKFIEHVSQKDSNLALSNPICIPSDPVDGQKIQLTVQATNFSTAIKQVPVAVRFGDQTQSQNLQIQPGSNAVASFETTYDENNSAAFTFSIPADQLAADNTAYIAAKPGVQTPIVVISDDPIGEVGTTAFFLERALRPFDSDKDRFSVTQLTSAQVQNNKLNAYTIAVVGYVANFDQSAIEELIRFVSEGGSLVYLCGEGNVSGNITAIENRAKQLNQDSTESVFFPFQLGRLESFDEFEKAPYIAAGKWNSRWLREYDLQSQVAIRQIRFPQVWSVDSTAPTSDVLLTYSNKAPAVATRAFGKGQVVLANLSPSIDFSEFGTYGSFVVLMQVLVKQLVEGDVDQQNLVGKTILFAPPKSTIDINDLSVVGPDGETVASIVAETNGKPTLLVDRPASPGFFRMQDDRRTIQSIAVNVDPRESDLSQIDPTKIQQFGSADMSVAESTKFGVNLIERGKPLWGWLAAIALIALAIESLLVGWWKR